MKFSNSNKKFLLLFLICSLLSRGQSSDYDSLLNKLSGNIQDTLRLKILIELSNICPEEQIIKYSEQAVLLSKRFINDPDKRLSYLGKKCLADATNNLGYGHQVNGKISEALHEFTRALNLREKIGDLTGMGETNVNIGYIYEQKGSITRALDYYQKGLELYEKSGNKRGMAYALNNIGFIDQTQGFSDKALELYNQSLKLREELKDDFGIAQTLTNLGGIFKSKGKYEDALECHKKALSIQEKIGDKPGASNSLNNIGYLYQQQKFLPLAISCYQKSLAIRKETGEKKGISTCLTNIGNIYLDQGQTEKALESGNEAMQIASDLGFPDKIRAAALLMKNAYKKKGNFKKAFEMDELYIKMNDSINNEEIRKSSARQQIKYEFEKRATEDSMKYAEEQKIKDVEIKAQKLEIKQGNTQKLALYGGLFLVAAFSIFIFYRLRESQKQKKIIHSQKLEVEQQKKMTEEKAAEVAVRQKEIVDSILYAEKIQRALVPSFSEFERILGEVFIFFRPKDIVSGDFYWIAEKEGQIFYATVDCTGHGVPGGFMSTLGISFLNEIVVEKKINEPAEVLDMLRIKIILALKQSGAIGESKDGMDMVFCKLDKKNMLLKYSAANNAPLVVRNKILSEYNFDKMPVGLSVGTSKQFTQHEIELKKGDIIYTLTDGFADQFGGAKGKKFKYKQLYDLLVSVSEEPMQNQEAILDKTLKKWKAWSGLHENELEQVDDITIIGVKI